MNFARLKAQCDKRAEQSAAICRMWLMRAGNVMAARMVQPNYRFFRRMAGLSGRDAKERG